MKSRIVPVILTAALTSAATLFAFQKLSPTPDAAPREAALPVNYVSYGGGDAQPLASNPPVDFQAAAEASVKAVVHIKTKSGGTRQYYDPWAELFEGNGYRRMPPQEGSGSGVVVSADGYIVTNNHVVAGADEVTVTFNDRYTATAKVVGTDPSTDIAVLKVEEKGLAFMEFGNSDDVKLGQWVLAVGYPLSLEATVTAGIVSAKSRSLGINAQQGGAGASAIESFIQTDAAVNPGNSGGALVNTAGQLVGINSAIASPTGSYAGYSYAVPSNIVRKVQADLRQFGTVQRGYLGIQMMSRRGLSAQRLRELGLDRTEGVYVDDVPEDGAAAKSGIKEGDIITAINGVAVPTEPELLGQVARYKPGDNVQVTYLRSGKSYTTSVQLLNNRGTTSVVKNNPSGISKLLGASMKTLSAAERQSYRVRGGIMVTEVGTGVLASQTNMRRSFVITTANDQAVASVEELQRAIRTNRSSLQLAGFYPGTRSGTYYYGLQNLRDEDIFED